MAADSKVSATQCVERILAVQNVSFWPVASFRGDAAIKSVSGA
jgi:hypothetical protein